MNTCSHCYECYKCCQHVHEIRPIILSDSTWPFNIIGDLLINPLNTIKQTNQDNQEVMYFEWNIWNVSYWCWDITNSQLLKSKYIKRTKKRHKHCILYTHLTIIKIHNFKTQWIDCWLSDFKHCKFVYQDS